jgi:hypothetical protein
LVSLHCPCAFGKSIFPSELFLLQVQDWLYTRESAKTTAAHALAIASSKQARLPPSLSPCPSPAVFRGSGPSNIQPLEVSFSALSSKPSVLTSSKNISASLLPPKHQPSHANAFAPGTPARSCTPSRDTRTPSLSAIDATITSMVASGASGTTAMQRYLKRSSTRAPSAAAVTAGAGSRKQHAAANPLQQLFSVIL